MTTTIVSSAAQLLVAARLARGGDQILLAPGSYGTLTLSNVHPLGGGSLVIGSVDPGRAAIFDSVKIVNSDHITLQSVGVQHILAANEPLYSQAIAVTKSSWIAFAGISVSGSLNGSSFDDGNGIGFSVVDHVSVVNSTFRQLRVGMTFTTASDVVVAGNTITEAREGIDMQNVHGVLLERNYLTNMQPNYAAGDHPDNFQISTGYNGAASSDVTFRDNVMIQGNSGFIGGIFIRSEAVAAGVRHSNITISNNYYEGTYRNAITVANTDGVVATNNTVLSGPKDGLAASINILDVHGAMVANNISPLLLGSAANAGVTYAGNVAVWDAKTKTGIDVAAIFDVRDAGSSDLGQLSPIAASATGLSGAGFHANGPAGYLAGPVDAMLAPYQSLFGHLVTLAPIA